MDWPVIADHIGKRNSHDTAVELKEHESNALLKAWGDPMLYKILELDMLLYGCATGVHRMQLAQHGLEPSGGR